MNKTCIIICGPTAVGKTSLAIELAVALNTEIISSDSRQCYKELNIGVAKPSIEELNTVPHHFVNSHSITEEVNAADFEKYALAAAEKIFEKKDQLVMVGGTGLYIKSFCEGLDAVPAVPESIRTEIILNYEQQGMAWLQDQIMGKDPLFFEKGEMHNPQRVMRALEVMIFTGNSILSYQLRQKKQRDFNVIKIGLELPREILYERINQRVDEMIAAGLEQEVLGLLPFQSLNALKTVGYSEFFEYFKNGNSKTFTETVERIKQHTRQYAKRQMTWFKRDAEIKWTRPIKGLSVSWVSEI